MPGSLNGATQNSLSAGSYTVTVTDGAGCTANLNVNIGQPTALSISYSNLIDASCGASDGAATVSASGGTGSYSYSWSPSGSGTNPTNLAPGAYTVTVTDQNNCTASTSFAIGTINGPSLVLSSSTPVSCNGANDGSATVSASGGSPGYTYTWMPGSLNGASQSNLPGGSYTVTVNDQGGCTDVLIVTITEPQALTLSASNIQDANCGASDGAATVTASGGTGSYTYTWSPAGSGTNPTNLAPGSYTVTVTDQNNCSASTSFTIGTLSGPTLTLDNSSDATCFGATDGSATVSASGGSPGYTYGWMPGGLNGAAQNSLAAGTYTVTVTDLGGCTDVLTVVIGEPTEILVTTVSVTDANCGASDGAATVSANGGSGSYSYSWSPSGGNGATANGLSAGTYTVTVTDQNGCSATETVTIGNIGGPSVVVQSTSDVSCAGAMDGSATVSVSGGTSPYSYAWSPTGGNGAAASNLSGGTYTVTVTDGAGCIVTTTVVISEPPAITLQANITDEDCGLSNGAINVQASGGTGVLVFGWSPNVGSGASVSNLNGGAYTVTVTDGNGCSVTGTYTVSVVGGITIDAFPETSSILEGQSVVLTATGAVTYSWTPASGLSCVDCASPTASPSVTTTYIVTGTDANGCSGSDTVTVYVQAVCGDLFVPNIFSPNGNGPSANENLCVYGNCISELHYAVYNRWGELVFETTSTDICWDGMYKGKPAISGVYAYKLYAILFDGEVVETSGNLTLVR
jgi:gliding motility-associated-like protein